MLDNGDDGKEVDVESSKMSRLTRKRENKSVNEFESIPTFIYCWLSAVLLPILDSRVGDRAHRIEHSI